MFVWFVSWPPFEYLIILTIIANCVVMSMDTHLPNGDKTILALQVSSTTPDMIYDYINDPIGAHSIRWVPIGSFSYLSLLASQGVRKKDMSSIWATKYLYIKGTTVYVPSSELILSHPLSRKRVCPFPPEPKGEGAHSPVGEGFGVVPIPTTGGKA